MCGIYCLVCGLHSKNDPKSPPQIEDVQRRGPDSESWITSLIGQAEVNLYGCVLHMRGELCEQPIITASEQSLVWNGEIFNGINVSSKENDGLLLYNLLLQTHSDDEVLNILEQIEGPYAFILLQATRGVMWFGRDLFGRRSLTYHINEDRTRLQLSSVIPSYQTESVISQWKELPASGLYKLDLNCDNLDIQFYPWKHIEHNPLMAEDLVTHNIYQSVSHRVMNRLNTSVPVSDDLLAKEVLLSSIGDLSPALSLLSDYIQRLQKELENAVARRVGKSSYFCHDCVGDVPCCNTHIAVLFSGGIDSMMLAHLADRLIPEGQPIDLLNVAFETPSSPNFEVPDRVTGRNALTELNPRRAWRFVEINITKSELQRLRQDRIHKLINPLDTVLDDSIGCALWFAARGQGVLYHYTGDSVNETSALYTSKARVLLSGLGADEQLGGYSRHRGSFNQGGWISLVEEINKDVERISYRNLGRDDRIISDHGKEVRFPFLDERVVSYLNSLPIQMKMRLDLPRGKGDKLLLRLLALREGLTRTAFLEKRAIQFGSRIAKCENRKEKGSDRCERLTNSSL